MEGLIGSYFQEDRYWIRILDNFNFYLKKYVMIPYFNTDGSLFYSNFFVSSSGEENFKKSLFAKTFKVYSRNVQLSSRNLQCTFHICISWKTSSHLKQNLIWNLSYRRNGQLSFHNLQFVFHLYIMENKFRSETRI